MNVSYELFVDRIFDNRVELKNKPVCVSSVDSERLERIMILHDSPKLERIL